MKIKLCLLSISLILFFDGNAQSNTQLEDFLKAASRNGYSGSVLVAKGGKIMLENGYGLADREVKKSETAETVFSIGSITKQFTAAAILKLEEEGKLKVTDKLSSYFPQAPDDKMDITLHQLLTHSAGFEGTIGDDYDNVNAKQFIEAAMQSKLLFKPGSQYEYSNVGYSLLGIIVEKISGLGYEKFLSTKLFGPSKMNSTGYQLPAYSKDELAVGYQNGKRWGAALDRPWLADGPGWHLRANGGILSTVGDMYKWYLSLKNNTVLPKTATDKLFSPFVAEGPRGLSHYGYGWVIQNVEGTKIVWHNGGNGVYNAIMSFEPDNDLCFIVSSNSNDIISDKIAIQVRKILDGKGYDALPESIKHEEDEFMKSPVAEKIKTAVIKEGALKFKTDHKNILSSAGFDFDNDMILEASAEQLLAVGKTEEAMALYEVYAQLFTKIVLPWNRLGKCYEKQGNKEKANECWQKSVSIRATNNPAVEWLKKR